MAVNNSLLLDSPLDQPLHPNFTSLLGAQWDETATPFTDLLYQLTTNSSLELYFANLSSTNSSNISHADIDYGCITFEPKFQVMLSHQFFLYASLWFIVSGLIGNSLSVLVFSSRGMRTVSSNFYLLVLALSDSAYLVSVFLTKILISLRCMFFSDQAIDIFNRSQTWCKLLQYLLDLFSDYSTCLILAFTVERYIACYHAVKFKEICTVRRARIACIVLFLVCGVSIAPYHVLYMRHYTGYNVCTVDVDYELRFTIWYVSEVALFRVIPVFVITILNVFIIVKVTNLTRERRRRMSSRTLNNNRKKRVTKDEKHMQLTIMLILVSTSYILVYLPVLVHFVIWKLQRSEIIVVSNEAMLIAQNYTKTFYISGFAINFFLYTLSGRVFREQLQCLLCVRFTKKKTPTNTFATTVAETTTLVTKV